MFGSIGWGEMVILVVAALVILGPERLPGAVMWVTKSMRQVREYASGASQQLRDELGPEFDEIRKPLSEVILRGELTNGDTARIALKADGSGLEVVPIHVAKPEDVELAEEVAKDA